MTFLCCTCSLRIPDNRSKISCGQVDMAFVNAVWQLNIVLAFLTSDFFTYQRAKFSKPVKVKLN